MDSEPVNNMQLHLDGRDKIQVHGHPWDRDDANEDDEFFFNHVFQGEDLGGLSPDGNEREFSITSEDAYGNIFRLFGTYQRTGVLFD